MTAPERERPSAGTNGRAVFGGQMKYSDLLTEWLVQLGYTHCFFVAGGNIMHLLDAVRVRMTCIPVVHEVAAGIAAEYFSETGGPNKAFALVTAGPGLTNIVTAVAGAWLESRELLVIGGQVKSTDLASGGIRQRGIQEVDGVAIVRPICARAVRVETPLARHEIEQLVAAGTTGRKGPVLLEICLDVQGAPVDRHALEAHDPVVAEPVSAAVARAREAAPRVARLVREAKRPVLLLGGGVSRAAAARLRPRLCGASVAVMATWNALDRVDARDRNYAGAPNTWGQRSANVLLQQADVIVALGSRLGLQQTGFNHREFAPLATVVQVDVDESELRKGHPHVELAVAGDADAMLEALLADDLGQHAEWLAFCGEVRGALPLADPENRHDPRYADPYAFNQAMSAAMRADDVVIPCSSGGAFTTAMQAFDQRWGQTIITNKGLAAMGYGLSGAIGAAFARPDRRVVLFEGDGGFSQNLQELATVSVNALRVKIFLVSNEGYASIRMTQRNYFGGAYVGCDVGSGLGFPRWDRIFAAYDIPALQLTQGGLGGPEFRRLFDAPGPAAFVVPVDPEQTYFPKITSRVTAAGSMESAPLHLMTPDLPDDVAARVMPYLRKNVVKA
ncbi:MAG TPA: thiamine pyrophosphate-binding protein [Dongiaceae bacterium]|nr:thiamine pyrophosphate-binding protein [Dongiaceae bacterium]